MKSKIGTQNGGRYRRGRCSEVSSGLAVQVSKTSCKGATFCSFLLKNVSQSVQIFFEMARGHKKLPIPVRCSGLRVSGCIFKLRLTF
jgi:hypothetical protein